MYSLLNILKRNIYLSLFSFLLLILFQGCVLTGSQVRITKNFFSSVKDVSKQCKVLPDASITVTYERKLLYPETYSNDSILVKELVENYESYSKEITSNDSFKIKVNDIGRYFHDFTYLLPKQESGNQVYDRKALSAIENFSSYLPFGLGLTIYKTLYDLVSYTARFIKVPHSRKKIKNYIINGETKVPENLDFICKELQTISKKLETEKKLVKLNYSKFLSEQKLNKTPIDYYKIYNPVFLEKYHLASSSSELSNSLIILIPEIKKAYIALYNETSERKKIKNGIPEISKMLSVLTISSRHFVIVNDAMKQKKSN